MQSILTPRQREVLRLVSNGLTADEIADRLAVSVRTVTHHKQQIYERLGAANQAQAVALALATGELAVDAR